MYLFFCFGYKWATSQLRELQSHFYKVEMLLDGKKTINCSTCGSPPSLNPSIQFENKQESFVFENEFPAVEISMFLTFVPKFTFPEMNNHQG